MELEKVKSHLQLPQLRNLLQVIFFKNHKLPIAITPEGYGDIIEVVGNTTMLSLNKNISLIFRKELLVATLGVVIPGITTSKEKNESN